ncbi:Indole-3-acetic acid-amido synthetase GH3.3 [Quillaja saponaria]|uniref:Indole-3-acetic acid-amido synthetase GH3.3 n=1 Tax=Quillaja saponaria TaxID=32244 RepID=A0AAD7PCY0_QUISA|nr:Indole-3-acetic acid-amido synthetase GH3.3 [Quillaja saponaria]
MMADHNKKALNFIEEITSNADEIQNRVLAEILSQNTNVEYLQRHGIDGRTDKETFKKLIPVIDYEYIKEDIDRIANGDTSPILCSKPITEFYSSSATSSGESKLIPSTEDGLAKRLLCFSLLGPVIDQFIHNLYKGKGMIFLLMKPESKTPGGLVAHPLTSSFLKKLKNSTNLKHYYDPDFSIYTSPIDAILCPDWYQSMYSQLLCGLCQNMKVLRVGAIFASGFIRAIKFLEYHWLLLCNDIRKGELDTKITDSSVRAAVMKILKPDPNLADFIQAECSKGSWKGIIIRLWPNTKYISTVVTGSMSQYIHVLDYYSDCLPLVSSSYDSSECHFGLNLNPLCNPSDISYTCNPTSAYFEFLPINRKDNGDTNSLSHSTASYTDNENQELVDLVDVELGQEYEVVATTYTGLYRYRVGDILRVSGFKNKTPQFNFVCRNNVVLSIDVDKTDEDELQKAVKNASQNLLQFDATLTDYTSYADISSIPGHYVLYWEISLNGQTPIPHSVFEDCCFLVEESLNNVYRRVRVLDKSITPLEIRVVKNGTFDKLMDYALSKGASASQYKTPRCVKHTPMIKLLNSNIVSSYFSPKYPTWIPESKKEKN